MYVAGMRPSRLLQLKSFVSKLHPPLPLAPRDSRKLLSLLRDSFQHQLDESHPDAIQRHTENHFDSILTNPLFSVPSKDDNLSDEVNNCMRQFDDATANGTATLDLATRYLIADLNSFSKKSQDVHWQKQYSPQIRKSGAAMKVLNWMWSYNLHKDFGVSPTKPEIRTLLSSLMPFIVMQKKRQIFWSWFSLKIEGLDENGVDSPTETDPGKNIFITKILLFEFVSATVKYGKGLNEAAKILVRAHDLLSQTPIDAKKVVLRQTARELLQYVIADAQAENRVLTPEQFTRIAPILEGYGGFCSGERMALVHPKSPSTTPALRALKYAISERDLKQYWRSRMAHALAIATMQFYISRKEQDGPDAQWVRDYIQNNFPSTVRHLHTTSSMNTHSSDNEALALRNLDQLAFA